MDTVAWPRLVSTTNGNFFSKLDYYHGSLEPVVRCYITLLLRNTYDVSQVVGFAVFDAIGYADFAHNSGSI